MPPLPQGSQHIVPYLYYDDPRAAVDYLQRAFGFEQTMLLEWPDGGLAHAELSQSGERVLVGAADPRFGLASPTNLKGLHAAICIYVEDIDAHLAHAQSHGAEIVQPLANIFYGARAYSAKDLEGNLWIFRQHQHEPTQEQLTAVLAKLHAAQSADP